MTSDCQVLIAGAGPAGRFLVISADRDAVLQ
jgi:flavin-dependent dehydrogenase